MLGFFQSISHSVYSLSNPKFLASSVSIFGGKKNEGVHSDFIIGFVS